MDDYDQDVEDFQIALKQAEKELKDAVEWHQKMLVQYAEAIIARDKAHKV